MIVYVESNFVLELAFLQEGSENTNAIIEIAEAGRIRLVLPAYCAGEPYERLVRRARDRQALREKLAAEIRELSHSKPYGDLAEASRELTSILAQSAVKKSVASKPFSCDSSQSRKSFRSIVRYSRRPSNSSRSSLYHLRTLSCLRRCRHTLVQCHRISRSYSSPRIPKTFLLPTFKSDWTR
jgi:hypothetical protein